jgi:uncharacterized protein
MIRQILLWLISVYWLSPVRWRRRCLFNVSCSHHIYTVIQTAGVTQAMKEFFKRYRQCRPGYAIYVSDDKKEWVVFADKTVVERKETTI